MLTMIMRKDRISIALTKEIIRKLDEESRRVKRSRSDLVQIILESYFAKAEESPETRRTVIPALRRAY